MRLIDSKVVLYQSILEMHHVQLFVRATMQTPAALGVMGFFLVFVPIIGMHLVHKYGWEHWEPFSKKHVSGGTPKQEE